MKYKMLKVGEVVRNGDEVLNCEDSQWSKSVGLIGLPLTAPWIGQVRRPIKPKPKKPLAALGHACINAHKAYHGKADCTHAGHTLNKDYTAWCPNCGAISVGGGDWKLPNSARHPYYK